MHLHVQIACADLHVRIACALHIILVLIGNVNTLFIVLFKFTVPLMILKQNPLQMNVIFSPTTISIGALVLLKYLRQKMNHIPLGTFPHLVSMTSLLPAHHQML